MARKPKVTENEMVSNWLIEHRWANTLSTETKHILPSFVEDAVMSAVYIVAGTTNGQVNISPKLVKKALMLREISVETARPLEVGYDISDRHSQRLAQTARFALQGIEHRIQEFENNLSEDFKMNRKQEWKFIHDYYEGRESTFYAKPRVLPDIPQDILKLYIDGKYLEYGEKLRAFRDGLYSE